VLKYLVLAIFYNFGELVCSEFLHTVKWLIQIGLTKFGIKNLLLLNAVIYRPSIFTVSLLPGVALH